MRSQQAAVFDQWLEHLTPEQLKELRRAVFRALRRAGRPRRRRLEDELLDLGEDE